MEQSGMVILGANGQIGTALHEHYPDARALASAELDITDLSALTNFDWSGVHTIFNAAAYTNVPEAESADGRLAAWRVNATAVGYLAALAKQHDIILVHISTSYVFVGRQDLHSEDEPLSPLSSYGSSKAAGDIAAATAGKHYTIRTSAVVGAGKNFVRSIFELGKKGVSPQVVADETDRPAFSTEIVRGIGFLLQQQAPYGVYNITNSGDIVSWADIARAVYDEAGYTNLTVTDSTAAEYFAGKAIADKRPVHGALDLAKMQNLDFTFTDWRDDLRAYIRHEQSRQQNEEDIS